MWASSKPDLLPSNFCTQRNTYKIVVPQLCQDIFQFPLVTARFCDEILIELDDYGEWANTLNYGVSSFSINGIDI